MEARIRELEKAAPCEVIDVDAAAENTMVVFSAIEELRKDTKEGWKKLAVPLDQVIEANNASNVGLKKQDVQLARRCQGHSTHNTPSELKTRKSS